MAEHDAISQPNLRLRQSIKQQQQQQQPGHHERDDHARSGYETGESSATGSLKASSHAAGSTTTPRSSNELEESSPPPAELPRERRERNDNGDRRISRGAHRSHKHRSSGAFLLNTAVFDDPPPAPRQNPSHSRRSRDAAGKQRQEDVFYTPDTSFGLVEPSARPDSALVEDEVPRGGAIDKRDSLASNASQATTQRGSAVPLDVESAQIVNMALNLSESRRIAFKRNVSHPLPPKLTPLPDTTAGGSLKQHLQQQRRASRTVSPKPDRGLVPRLPSGYRVNSPLQGAFDLPDGVFRYHFSQSTLARVEKAKQYLELLAQHRRVLDFVPDLTPDRGSRPATLSPPSSPIGSTGNLAHVDTNIKLGRVYNPLQYIRNRKVRGRERKTIDGEAQGFGDVAKVRDWVDDVAKWAVNGQASASATSAAGYSLPPFSAVGDFPPEQGSPPSASTRPSITASKPKRPRVDWVIDPADMLADVYWLEQDDNKRLVEDRHWRRVFPQTSDAYRPQTRQNEEPSSAAAAASEPPVKEPSDAQPAADISVVDFKPQKAEHDHVFSGARERARQKLHDLRGLHHRHSSSAHTHDFFRIRRNSLSDSSDTDSGRKRRSRTDDNHDESTKTLLEKQMMELVEKEARENDGHALFDPETQRFRPPSSILMTPEKERGDPLAGVRSQTQSRRDSRADLSGYESRGSAVRASVPSAASPPRSGRTSLDVPPFRRRYSVDYDSSRANSPELRPTVRDNAFVPFIGMDLSPRSSRQGSPTRHPFSKARQKLREGSGDRIVDASEDKQDSTDGNASTSNILATARTETESVQSAEGRSSRSPNRKLASRGTEHSHRSNRSLGSIRLRSDDTGIGLRNIFKGGPRIDSVLRSGVSKVGELFWRKDSSDPVEGVVSGTSSDESDLERKRGRQRVSSITSRASSIRGNNGGHQHRGSKHYLDVMPSFLPSSDSHRHKSTSSDTNSLVVPGAFSSSKSPSRRSSRFDLLKPPKIDIRAASPTSSSPPAQVARFPRDSDISDTDSRKSSYTDGVRVADARLNAILSMPPNRPAPIAPAPLSRHWSISDRRPSSPAQTSPSRRELARIKTLILSSAIMAMEIDRRARERRILSENDRQAARSKAQLKGPPAPESGAETATPTAAGGISWAEVARLAPPGDPTCRDLAQRPIAQTELYPLAARVLGASVQSAGQEWQAAADDFAARGAPALQARFDALRLRVSGELGDLASRAADDADEASRDLVTGQRLKVKRVVDTIEKMLRRRRRRFRWVRRGGWLAVEWVLVGFMWYVWFVVMIARVVLGVGMGAVRCVRWLLWL